jgi:hypothetical protein
VSLLEMQRALGVILTEPPFLGQFMQNSEAALSRFSLTVRETDSLLSIDRKRLVAHAELLWEGRLAFALKAFPIFGGRLAEQLHGMAGQFCTAYPPLPVNAPQLRTEADRLMRFLEESSAQGLIHPAYLVELARLEHALLCARGYWSEDAAAAPADFPASDTSEGYTVSPLTFVVDLSPESTQAVVDAQLYIWSGLPSTASGTIVLVLGRSGGSVDVFRINQWMRKLLTLTDGARDELEVCSRFTLDDKAAAGEEFPVLVADAMQRLVDIGAIQRATASGRSRTRVA